MPQANNSRWLRMTKAEFAAYFGKRHNVAAFTKLLKRSAGLRQRLIQQPELAAYSPWRMVVSSELFCHMLWQQPKLVRYSRGGQLSVAGWGVLLLRCPQIRRYWYQDLFEPTVWAALYALDARVRELIPVRKLPSMAWRVILQENPELAEHCPWHRLDGRTWACLLQRHPEYAIHCNWKKLRGRNWSLLLRDQPQFAEHCDWSKLDGYAWATLLRFQPQLAEHCDWKKLTGDSWEQLLTTQPEFVLHCPWRKLQPRHIARLLQTQPEWRSYCNWEKVARKLDPQTAADVIAEQPSLYVPWFFHRLPKHLWTRLLVIQPALAANYTEALAEASATARNPAAAQAAEAKRFTDQEWRAMVHAQPTLLAYCPLRAITLSCVDRLCWFQGSNMLNILAIRLPHAFGAFATRPADRVADPSTAAARAAQQRSLEEAAQTTRQRRLHLSTRVDSHARQSR